MGRSFSLSGTRFVEGIARQLLDVADAEAVAILECESNGRRVVPVGAVQRANGEIEIPDFDGRHTAISEILESGSIEIASGACRTYPTDPVLARTAADRVVGIALADQSDAKLGAVLVVCRPETGDIAYTRTALHLFAPRIALELECRRNERTLRESETRFRLAALSAVDFIYEWRLESDDVQWFGQPIEETLGYIPQTFADWERLIHPDDRARILSIVDATQKSGESFAEEYRVITKDKGQLVWFDRGHWIEPERTRFIGAVHDLTEPRRLEEQLRQTQKLEAIGRLSAGIAHDFNNILAIVMGFANELAQGSSEPSVREAAFEIECAADRAANLTKQLLSFSRQDIVRPSLVDVNVVIRKMERMLERLFRPASDLMVSLSSDSPCVLIDRAQLEQVLLNLTLNAHEAIAEGGTAWLSTRVVDKPAQPRPSLPHAGDGYLELAVRDSGVGIPPEAQTRIFEPFFTTKGDFQGTGLGLATAYGIIRQNQGDIAYESRLGEGTTFTVWLPIAVAPAGVYESAGG